MHKHDSRGGYEKARDLTLLLVLQLFIGCCGYASDAHVSVTDIIASTPERWQQKYQTKWRDVNIDIPVAVPFVPVFPLLRVTYSDPVPQGLLAGYGKVYMNRGRTFHAYTQGMKVVRSAGYKSSQVYPGGAVPDVLPENNQMGYQEAVDILHAELGRLFSLTKDDLVVEETTVLSRLYRRDEHGAEFIWREPITQKGEYAIQFRQRFHGITYYPAKACYQQPSLGREDAIPGGMVYAKMTDEADFGITATLLKEMEVVQPDLPLLPFHLAKQAFEAEIMAGRLRSIEKLELCYVPYLDKDKENVFWLLPAWYVQGGYSDDPQQAFEPLYDNGILVHDGIQRQQVVFNAQSGTLIDYFHTNPRRRMVPAIITWEKVK